MYKTQKPLLVFHCSSLVYNPLFHCTSAPFSPIFHHIEQPYMSIVLPIHPPIVELPFSDLLALAQWNQDGKTQDGTHIYASWLYEQRLAIRGLGA